MNDILTGTPPELTYLHPMVREAWMVVWGIASGALIVILGWMGLSLIMQNLLGHTSTGWRETVPRLVLGLVAAAALMQPRFFALFAETTGLDVMALQRTYGRAYSSLTIRLAEVMRHQPLLAVLYERRGGNDPHMWAERPSPEEFTATVVARTPGFRLRTVKRPLSALRGMLPRRGYPPAQYSMAERVILTGEPVNVEQVTGYDLWNADDITVAARLVNWHGRLAKIALVAVPYRDRKVLAPQLSRVSFEHIPHAHQVI